MLVSYLSLHLDSTRHAVGSCQQETCTRHQYRYDRGSLLSLYSTNSPHLFIADRVRSLGLWSVCRFHYAGSRSRDQPSRLRLHGAKIGVWLQPYRGYRGGSRHRHHRPTPVLRAVDSGAYVATSKRAPSNPAVNKHLMAIPRRLIRVNCAFKELVFGCLNIRSLHNKLDDFLEVRRQCSLDVVCLSETWYDADSVCVRRLRASGYQVADRPRPHPSSEIRTMGTNHGGVLVATVLGIRLSSVTSATVAITAVTSFEAICVRVSTGSFNCVVLAIYRTGSEEVTASFFDELADVLDRIAVLREPIFVAGDVNICLDRPDDQNTCHLLNLFDCYGFVVYVAGVPTHDSGGSIDIVALRSACSDPIFLAGGPVVSVLDPGLSDHRLLRWSVAADIPPHPQHSTFAWRQLSVDDFIREVQASALCRPECWQRLNLDEMAALYDSELTAVADRLVSARIVVCRQRPFDPWFDNDCR
jgi:hypothetical protein